MCYQAGAWYKLKETIPKTFMNFFLDVGRSVPLFQPGHGEQGIRGCVPVGGTGFAKQTLSELRHGGEKEGKTAMTLKHISGITLRELRKPLRRRTFMFLEVSSETRIRNRATLEHITSEYNWC